MNAGTSLGRMPVNVSVSVRATVTAGLANDPRQPVHEVRDHHPDGGRRNLRRDIKHAPAMPEPTTTAKTTAVPGELRDQTT